MVIKLLDFCPLSTVKMNILQKEWLVEAKYQTKVIKYAHPTCPLRSHPDPAYYVFIIKCQSIKCILNTFKISNFAANYPNYNK